jgi:putative N6-adenine-specific DNA methylase
MSMSLIATCAVGIEELLATELRQLGLAEVAVERGAVAFAGGWPDVWRTNWRLRTANRVVVELGQWPAVGGDAIHSGVMRLVQGGSSWDGVGAAELFDPRSTLAVRATTSRSAVRDVRWAALRAKDGVVDAQRKRFGRRAAVERRNPDLMLRLRIDQDRASLLLDTSGMPLDRRGYRVMTGSAPVREQLAAACVLAVGDWPGEVVIDPMCGTGTLLAEAGWIATGVPPGVLRSSWAFTRLPGFDRKAFERIRSEPVPAQRPSVRLIGRDTAPGAIEAARRNLAAAKLRDRSSVAVGDAFTADPPSGPGLVLMNPPYGERSDSERDQWRRIGDLLKQRYQGWRAVVLAGDPDQGKWIGLRSARRLPVRNGPIAAKILVFDLY